MIADSTSPAALRLSGIVRACQAAAFLWNSSGAAAEATGITKEAPPDWVMERAVPSLSDAEFGNPVLPIIQTVVQAAIWIPYTLVSQRVKATFHQMTSPDDERRLFKLVTWRPTL